MQTMIAGKTHNLLLIHHRLYMFNHFYAKVPAQVLVHSYQVLDKLTYSHVAEQNRWAPLDEIFYGIYWRRTRKNISVKPFFCIKHCLMLIPMTLISWGQLGWREGNFYLDVDISKKGQCLCTQDLVANTC